MSKTLYKPEYHYTYNGRYYEIWDSDTIARKEQLVSDFIAGIERGQVTLFDYYRLFRSVDSDNTNETYKEDIRYILTLIKLSNIKPKISTWEVGEITLKNHKYKDKYGYLSSMV